MAFVPASPASLGAFVTILVVVSAAIIWAIGHARQSAQAAAIAAGGLAVWLAGIAMLVHSGRMATLPLNGLPLIFGPVLLFSTALGLSAVGRHIAASIPIALLVGFQASRLPLELVLHSWAQQGTIPETMTWTGQNWDIVSGALALIAAPLATRFPTIVRITNIVGLALLLNVMRVAILSSPVPFGWSQQPSLLLAFHLPYAFIAPVCVGGALFGHIVLTRAVWKKEKGSVS